MTPLSAKEIKFIKSLQQKKCRKETGLFVVEGEKLVNEAISSAFKVRMVYKTSEIGTECMSRISSLKSPSPALAVVEQLNLLNPDSIFSKLENKGYCKKENSIAPLCLGLDNVKDPGNFGTIVRIADWFGIDAIFASNDTVELYNPKTVQATMGAIFRVPVFYGDLSGTVELFENKNLPVYGTFLDGSLILGKSSIDKKGLIVMGSESFGISDKIRNIITPEKRIFIPSYASLKANAGHSMETSESLNVAIATAIVCAEFRLSC